MRIDYIGLCFDMSGCPNNCMHCWLKDDKVGKLDIEQVEKYTNDFKSLTKEIDVYTWYLEPDFHTDYKNLWKLEKKLSSKVHTHFELMSDWRIVRDTEYVKWAYEIGVRKCQLTFFGMEETTNRFTGRKNAFSELVEAIDILIYNGITPRIQLFAYHTNLSELIEFEAFIKRLRVEERCNDAGIPFELFIHTGSCIGRSQGLYDEWLLKSDLELIPNYFIEHTQKHYNTKEFSKIFGDTEQNHFSTLVENEELVPIQIDRVIFYIDAELDVYPHFAVHKPWWLLGNLKKSNAETIVNRYLNGKTFGQKMANEIPISEMVREFGDSNSERMFICEDYIEYIREKYLESRWNNEMQSKL